MTKNYLISNDTGKPSVLITIRNDSIGKVIETAYPQFLNGEIREVSNKEADDIRSQIFEYGKERKSKFDEDIQEIGNTIERAVKDTTKDLFYLE